MHNDDLVRSVRKGRRVKLVRQLACQGHGAGLSLETFGRQTFALNFLSATTPVQHSILVHNVMEDVGTKLMADRFHSEYSLATPLCTCLFDASTIINTMKVQPRFY